MTLSFTSQMPVFMEMLVREYNGIFYIYFVYFNYELIFLSLIFVFLYYFIYLFNFFVLQIKVRTQSSRVTKRTCRRI